MRRQDSKAALALWAATFLAAAACGRSIARPEASVSAPPVAVAGACYAASDCSGGRLCVDPRYPLCGAIPACEESGLVRCGCTCVVLGAAVCAADEVRGAAGCCEPRACAADSQCGVADGRCLSGRCARAGTCELPPP
jgi:hypothetical protein